MVNFFISIFQLHVIFNVLSWTEASTSADAANIRFNKGSRVGIYIHSDASTSIDTRTDRLTYLYTSRTNILRRLRGGGMDNPRNMPSFGSKLSGQTQQRQRQPTSFKQTHSQSQSFSPSPSQSKFQEVEVTDVTNAVKSEEREDTKEVIDAFLTRESRNSFITRVYAILSVQLLMVAASVLAFGKYSALRSFMLTRGKFVPIASVFISTVTVIFMSLSERARQVAPLKWQLLGLFSVAEAIVVGLISSFYKSKTVMSAALSTAVATMSVTMYTFLNKNSKRDLSQWGAGLSSVGMIFVFYGIIQALSMSGILPPEFLPYNESVYCMLGASLFSMYLAYHTRLVVSGKHSKYQLNEKDYVFGAVLLYNDIINIFLYMLRLMAAEDHD